MTPYDQTPMAPYIQTIYIQRPYGQIPMVHCGCTQLAQVKNGQITKTPSFPNLMCKQICNLLQTKLSVDCVCCCRQTVINVLQTDNKKTCHSYNSFPHQNTSVTIFAMMYHKMNLTLL